MSNKSEYSHHQPLNKITNQALKQKAAVIAKLPAEVVLWALTGYSHKAYQRCIDVAGEASAALKTPISALARAKLHANHIAKIQAWQQFIINPDTTECIPEITALLHSAQLVIENKVTIITMDSHYYPALLKHIADPPMALFVRGVMDNLLMPQIAMVGSRKPSPSGKGIAISFAQSLAASGMCITSGFAEGIDAASHKGALDATAKTIAVMGTGIMQCYPAKHQGLYREILEKGGTLLSEFLPNTPPLQHNFPRRNRIISGMSLATVVVEAAQRSGSLITAQQAAEQGRLVFAIPSHIDNVMAKGCHDLIREGAILVDCPSQILLDLQVPESTALPETGDSERPNLTASLPAELVSLLAAIDWNGSSADQLVESAGIDISQLMQQLTLLELQGLVVSQQGRYYKCRKPT